MIRILRAAAAPRTAMVLMAAFAAFCVSGFLVNRENGVSPSFFGSPLVLSASGLAALVLVYSLWLQSRRLLRSSLKPDSPGGVLPRCGALILHTGLLMLILAGLWAYAFEARGFLQLMEGETFSGSEPELLQVEKGRLAGSFNAPFRLTLNSLAHDYWANGEPRDFASLLLVEDSDGAREERLAFNSPLNLSGISVFQSPHYGYSVTVGLKRPAGEEVFTHFLLDRPGSAKLPATGGSDFPTTAFQVNLSLKPDPAGGSFFLKDPLVEAVVTEGGIVAYKGPLSAAAGTRFSGGELRLADLRYWSGISLSRGRAAWIAYLGFALCILGAALIYARPRGAASATEVAYGG